MCILAPAAFYEYVMTSGTIGPKMSVIGDKVQLVPADHVATFQIQAVGFKRNDIRASVLSKPNFFYFKIQLYLLPYNRENKNKIIIRYLIFLVLLSLSFLFTPV